VPPAHEDKVTANLDGNVHRALGTVSRHGRAVLQQMAP
jgi:hypothetical protein